MERFGAGIFEELARRYPVSCGSDEFYFFPHMHLDDTDWGRWDAFSPGGVSETARLIAGWEDELERLTGGNGPSTLKRFLKTLREELTEVSDWERQPTLCLTLAAVGMTEAVEHGDADAVAMRGQGLGAFFKEAAAGLRNVPLLFKELALEMLPETREFLLTIEREFGGFGPLAGALDEYEEAVKSLSPEEGFTLEGELYERIVREHFGCGVGIAEIRETLESEIKEMEGLAVASRRGDRRDATDAERGDTVSLYAAEVERLRAHSIEKGFVSNELAGLCPVRVAPVPRHLMKVRKASGYSVRPVTPPVGGVFHLISEEPSDELSMLSAHETYPGHHMLDSARLLLKDPVRRAVELPLFYEGWACFAEGLLSVTGYYSTEEERRMLARRRLRRAARGMAELALGTGEMDVSEAAKYLSGFGLDPSTALGSVKRYPLNPGYQLCYTVGLRKFLELFERYGAGETEGFVRTVLGGGEVGFAALKEALRQGRPKI